MSAASETPAKRPRTDDSGEAGGAAAGPVVLYSYWRSSASYRLRIVLNLKGIAAEYKAVHLLKEGGMHLKDDYKALNPSKRVPTLVIDGHTLGQSAAIIEYLEETRPAPPLLPKDAFHRAVVRQIVNVISNDMQPLGNLVTIKSVAALVADPAEKEAKKEAWIQSFYSAGFEALEALLKEHAGKYCVGDDVTMADAFLVPQVFAGRRFKVDFTPYPTVVRVAAALEALPAFADAHPSKQPDAE